MNSREPTSAPLAGAGSALPCWVLLVLSLLLSGRAWAGRAPCIATAAVVVPPKPYLIVLGAPPLRFAELAPPAELLNRPRVTAPTHSDAEKNSATTASVANPPVDNPAPASTAAPAGDSANPEPKTAAVSEKPTGETPSAPPAKTPPPILPDEMRTQVHPEDFLPFFQLPASQPGEPTVIVPVPRQTPTTTAPIPPSSATYTQSPR